MIKEDGNEKTMTVDKLRTADGTRLIQEDDIKLARITITGNGTYKASDKNLYGFDEVVVSVADGGGKAVIDGDRRIGQPVAVDVRITEGGEPRVMSGVIKATTDLAGGGVCDWLVDEGLDVSTLHVDQNGTYMASSKGCYGFGQVIVSVDHSGGGGGGGGGEDEIYGAESIRVTWFPQAIKFDDGDYISYDGIEVTAYDGGGNALGVVPFWELIFPVSVASCDGDDSIRCDVAGTPLNDPVYMEAIVTGQTYQGDAGVTESRYITGMTNSAPVYMIQIPDYQDGHTAKTFVSMSPFTVESKRVAPSTWDPQYKIDTSSLTTIYGVSAYTTNASSGPSKYNVAISAEQDYGVRDVAVLALNALYGAQEVSYMVDVPILWARPEDGNILETSLTIFVYRSEPITNDD